jgi:hypothetical protein
VTLWANTTVVHLIRDGRRIKTVPSRLGTAQLQQLLNNGGRPAGPAPITTDARGPVEVDRLVNPVGNIGLARRQRPVGYHLAGQRVTIRLDAQRKWAGPVAGRLWHRFNTNAPQPKTHVRIRTAHRCFLDPAASATDLATGSTGRDGDHTRRATNLIPGGFSIDPDVDVGAS